MCSVTQHLMDAWKGWEMYKSNSIL